MATNILSDRLRHLVDEGVLIRRPYQDRPVRHEYRLTDKGQVLYPVPLALLAWGARWCPDSSGISLTHQSCGERLDPVLSCGTCAQAAGAGDVTYAAPENT